MGTGSTRKGEKESQERGEIGKVLLRTMQFHGASWVIGLKRDEEVRIKSKINTPKLPRINTYFLHRSI